VPLTGPSNEKCDGFDNDCNGQTDDGDICPSGEVCDNGNCVPECGGEFPCPADRLCDEAKGLCVDPDCVGINCPGTSVQSRAASASTRATAWCARSRDRRASPAAASIRAARSQCDDHQVCVEGACVDTCDCTGCSVGETCLMSGLCVFDACVDVDCPNGGVCQSDGTCADGCAGVVCPAGQVCEAGECIDDPNPGTGGGGEGGGGLLTGGSSAGGSNAGGQSQGGGSTGEGGGGGGGGSSSDGCDCGTTGRGTSGPGAAWMALLVWAGLRRRRAW
jgi:MYXO-CTERM domain-containing protein